MAEKIRTIFLGTIPFVLLLLVWHYAGIFDLFPEWLIPTPKETLIVFWELLSGGTFPKLVWESVQNVIPAFLIACVVAFVVGTMIGISPTAKKILFPFLSAVYPIPSLAYLPLIILFFGFTRETLLIVVFLSAFRKMIYSVIGGVRNVNKSWLLVGENIGLSRLSIVYKIILPASLPQIITGMRLGFGSAWRSLIGAEMLVAGIGGLGRFIWTSQWFYQFSSVFSGIIVIAIVGVLVEQLIFKTLEDKTLVRWGLSTA